MEETEKENKNQLSENDEKDRKNMLVVLKTLRSQAVANMEYFQVGSDSTRSRFHAIFCLLHDHLERGIEPFVDLLFGVASQYDACGVRANGYRSLIKIIQRCCITVLQITRHICVNKESMLFRSSHYCRELEAYVTTLGQLRACLVYIEKLPELSEKGSLFANEDKLMDQTADELMMEVESLNQECFYGRCLGFQYCESLQKPFRMIAIAMASFSDGFSRDTTMAKFASSVMSSGKYFMNPELRAQQVIATTTNADIGFCKAFWNLTEHDFFQDLPMIVCPPVHLSQPIIIHPDSFELPRRDGKGFATILPPTAHRGPGPIYCRLISHEYREGQEQLCKKDTFSQKSAPPSPCLIIHCHGGGFVAQSSKSHETYLRHWARDLRVPILSIDYSLAPEDPFPRAVQECFFVYAWALDNCDLLGSTGEHICVCGDSAGGNLTMSICVKAIQMGIRLPDGIMAAYPALLVRFTPTPSRLLAIMDPLLPVGVLSRCLAAYAGVAEADIPKHFAAAKRRNSSCEAVVNQPKLRNPKFTHSASFSLPRGSPMKFMIGEEGEDTSIEDVLCMSCQSDRSDGTSNMVFDQTLSDCHSDRSNGTSNMVFDQTLSDCQSDRSDGTSNMVFDQTLSDLADKLCEEEFSGICSENQDPEVEDNDNLAYTANGATMNLKGDNESSSTKSLSGESAIQDDDINGSSSLISTTSPHTNATETFGSNFNYDDRSEGLELNLSRDLDQKDCARNLTLDPHLLGAGGEAGVWHMSLTPSTDSAEYMDTASITPDLSTLSPSSQEYEDATDTNPCSRESEQIHTYPHGTCAFESIKSPASTEVDMARDSVTASGCTKSDDDIDDDKDLECEVEVLEENMLTKSDTDSFSAIESDKMRTSSDNSHSEFANLKQSEIESDNEAQVNSRGDICAIGDGATGRSQLENCKKFANPGGNEQSKMETDWEEKADEEESAAANTAMLEASGDVTTLLGKTSCEVPSTEQQVEGVVIGCEAADLDSVNATSSGDEIEDDIRSDTVDSGFSNSEEEWAVYEEGDILALDKVEKDTERVEEPVEGAVGGASPSEAQSKTLARAGVPTSDSAWSSLIHSTWAFSNKFTNQNGLKLHFSNLSSFMGFSNKSARSLHKSPSTPTLSNKPVFQPAKRNISSFKNITHPLHHFRYLPVTKDPLMSPFLASDEILKQMPPVYLVAAHLDPLLDDSVMFAKKLDSLGKEVHLDVFEDIPHGFLNFVLLSKEAKKAGDKCVARIREILMRNMKNSTPPLRKLSSEARESK